MSKIPEFRSIEEEAEFWDTHDSEEFADEFEKVDVKFADSLKHRRLLTIELDEESFDKVKRMAEEKGKEPDWLIRLWVLDHLIEKGEAEKRTDSLERGLIEKACGMLKGGRASTKSLLRFRDEERRSGI